MLLNLLFFFFFFNDTATTEIYTLSLHDALPISRVATQPNLLAAHPKVPAKTVAELIQYARANPGKLTYASNGNGSPQHLAAEQLKRMAGIDLVHVPYKGAAPTAAALLAGEV